MLRRGRRNQSHTLVWAPQLQREMRCESVRGRVRVREREASVSVCVWDRDRKYRMSVLVSNQTVPCLCARTIKNVKAERRSQRRPLICESKVCFHAEQEQLSAVRESLLVFNKTIILSAPLSNKASKQSVLMVSVKHVVYVVGMNTFCRNMFCRVLKDHSHKPQWPLAFATTIRQLSSSAP